MEDIMCNIAGIVHPKVIELPIRVDPQAYEALRDLKKAAALIESSAYSLAGGLHKTKIANLILIAASIERLVDGSCSEITRFCEGVESEEGNPNLASITQLGK